MLSNCICNAIKKNSVSAPLRLCVKKTFELLCEKP